MKKLIILSLVLVCAGIGKVSAQTEIFELVDKEQIQANVNLVDEFIARFNGDKLRRDIAPEASDRESNILRLFDKSKFSSLTDSNFLKAKEFARVAVENNIRLHFEDTCWFAKIKCHGKLAKKDVTFFMTLNVEKRDSLMYKWVINGVEGDIFLTSRDRPHKELFLMPNDNEQFFMSIPQATLEAYRLIDDYVKQGYKADALSTFLALVRNNQLKIEYVSDVEFTFNQVPNYVFTIKHFERDNKNSGWLIDSFSKFEPSIGEFVVRRFGESLRLWCETGNFYYRKKTLEECSNGCRISGSLIRKLPNMDHLPLLDDYLMVEVLLTQLKNVKAEISDIRRVEEAKGDIECVSCKITLTGSTALNAKMLFYIQNESGKVLKIDHVKND